MPEVLSAATWLLACLFRRQNPELLLFVPGDPVLGEGGAEPERWEKSRLDRLFFRFSSLRLTVLGEEGSELEDAVDVDGEVIMG